MFQIETDLIDPHNPKWECISLDVKISAMLHNIKFAQPNDMPSSPSRSHQKLYFKRYQRDSNVDLLISILY